MKIYWPSFRTLENMMEEILSGFAKVAKGKGKTSLYKNIYN